ncbi:MAG TPA: serine/threonine-protein kinase [Polyangiales bacterium]
MAKAGDVVGGKYRLIHPLGIGGMGAVWRAEHKDLRQHVAIKLLDARGPHADRAVRRFQREAQIAASIRHRNVVYISDFGTSGREPFLVMELLSGVPLSERMVVGEPLSVGVFLAQMEEALLGLAAVHAAGVVHRDMKPENIFLVREADGTTFPKLLDFGVSRSTERNQGHTITREGVVMGTPEYVSPEQARGRPADVRSDLYSLGVVMYEALAGRLPFQADNAADLIVSVLNAHPVPLVSFRPDLGEPLSQFVSKAMARDPEQRFASADEMRAALAALVAAQPELESAMLPRRFHTPQDAGGPVEDTARESMLPTTEGFAAARKRLGQGPVGTLVALFQHGGQKAIAAGVMLAAAAVVLLALTWGGGDSASSSRAAAAAPSAAEPRQPEMKLEPQPVSSPVEIMVELFGLPADAQVRLDGQPVNGSVLRMARGSGRHAIDIEAKGREPFHISHDAERDGRYAIAMALLPKKPAKSVVAKPGSKSVLLRRPDF